MRSTAVFRFRQEIQTNIMRQWLANEQLKEAGILLFDELMRPVV
jgi:hypothetical protein